MKVLKKVLIAIGVIVVVLLVAFVIYLLANRQGVIESFEFANPEAEHRVLIASQGSDFKNALVDSLTTYLKQKSIYIKIIDVTTLHEVSEDEWDAVALIHTTEMNKLQPDVKKYLARIEDLDKVILVTTSGPGNWKTEEYDVDALTSASTTEELSSLPQYILVRIDQILAKE